MFAYNNKVHTGIKISSLKANHRQDPRIGFELRKKGKHEKAEKFAIKIKKIQKKAKVALKKV